MQLIEVEELPETERRTERGHNDIYDCLCGFMELGMKIAWVVYDPHEYSSVQSAYVTFYRACRKYEFPISPCVRNGDLYLVRTDM